jgi:hypothetical protein
MNVTFMSHSGRHLNTTFEPHSEGHRNTTFRGCSKYNIWVPRRGHSKYHIWVPRRGHSKYNIWVPRRGHLRHRIYGRPRVGGKYGSCTLLEAPPSMMLTAHAQSPQELRLEPSFQTPECIAQVLLQASCEYHAQAQWGAATSTIFIQASSPPKLRYLGPTCIRCMSAT